MTTTDQRGCSVSQTRFIEGRPPVWDALVEAIPTVVDSGPFYLAYDHGIYACNKAPLPPSKQLVVHEEVHFKQQDEYEGGPDAWWSDYLGDERFRLEQEIEAYATQIAWHKNQGGREWCLHWAASAISSPLYGNLLTYEEAKEVLRSTSALLGTEATNSLTSDDSEPSN